MRFASPAIAGIVGGMERLGHERAIDVLSRSGWLAGEDAAFRAEVLARACAVEFAAGSVIYRIGDPPGGIYGLADGAVALSFVAGEGGAGLLQYGAAGGWTGVGCFLTGGPRHGELRAASDCLLLYLPLAAMEEMAARAPETIRAFARIEVLNLELALAFLRVATLPTSERRVAAALLQASRAPAPRLALTQVELATVANCSLRQVSAAMRGFVRARLVAQGYRTIRVLDAPALAAVAAGGPVPGSRPAGDG